MNGKAATRVLIVDDSPVARESLAHVFSLSARIEVLQALKSGSEALGYVQAARAAGRELPDVVVMDIVMPGMDGFETTRAIMASTPLPIIITSAGLDTDTAEKTFRALEAGAVNVMRKPPGPLHPEYRKVADELCRFVESMARVPVIRRWAKNKIPQAPLVPTSEPSGKERGFELVAIGASTGGPAAIQALLEKLPAPFPLPVLIVQHIAKGFISAMAEWMSKVTGHRVVVAADGSCVSPGMVYLAPDDFHMVLSEQRTIRLAAGTGSDIQCPSVDRLFRSVAAAIGASAIGVLMTGMGQDGAEALKSMRDAGALTIVQDKESSVVFGMPGAALRLGAAKYSLSPAEIAEFIAGLTQKKV